MAFHKVADVYCVASLFHVGLESEMFHDGLMVLVCSNDKPKMIPLARLRHCKATIYPTLR